MENTKHPSKEEQLKQRNSKMAAFQIEQQQKALEVSNAQFNDAIEKANSIKDDKLKKSAVDKATKKRDELHAKIAGKIAEHQKQIA